MATVMSAGTIAISRVIRRRSHGRSRMLRNPSITICPASVPVSVAFCPAKSSASAKSVLAMGAPRSGDNSWYASEMSATFSWPVPWNVAAAMTRIAPLRNNANMSATVESIVANRTASVRPSAVSR